MKKIGILGGGQLGRMLLQAAANYPVITYVLEDDPACPAAHLCHQFTQGDITSYEDVYNFGCGLDALTIEIEKVNTDALEQLEKEGVLVIPKPSVIKLLNNKVLQKKFYKEHGFPSSEFVITNQVSELETYLHFLPAVHKLAVGGYDGRGVQVIKSMDDITRGFDAPAVLEKMVSIHQEIAIQIAVSQSGEIAIYPTVDMVFDPELNLLSYQISPANVSEKAGWRLEAVAVALIKALKSPGIFSLEFFIDTKGDVYLNETAPRVHNSGHHTIEANYCSQFDMLWRILLNYPMGNPDPILPAAIVNLLGAEGHNGSAYFEGLNKVLSIPNAFVHLYGKTITKPGRKMGHVTIISKEQQELIHQINRIRQHLKVISTPA